MDKPPTPTYYFPVMASDPGHFEGITMQTATNDRERLGVVLSWGCHLASTVTNRTSYLNVRSIPHVRTTLRYGMGAGRINVF